MSTVGGYHEYHGGYLEYRGGSQHRGGYHDARGDIMSTMGVFNTMGDTVLCNLSTVGGIMIHVGIS